MGLTIFCITYGGKAKGIDLFPHYKPSPIPNGGIGIMFATTFLISDDKWNYLVCLKLLITENYRHSECILISQDNEVEEENENVIQ